MIESMNQYDGTYSVQLGTMKLIATQDPAFADHVLRANHRNYVKSPIQTEKLGRFIGNGLLTSNGEYWLRQRRLIQPGFHTERIARLYEIIGTSVQDFLPAIETGAETDVYPHMNKLAFRIVIDSLFNINVPEEVQSELASHIFNIQDFLINDLRKVYKRWWHKVSGEDALNLKRAARMRDIIRGMVRQRLSSGQKVGDLLDMLLEARYEDNGEAMTEDQLIDEITILIIAGHETTANALAWALYLLAVHPEEQNRLREEVSRLTQTEAVKSTLISSIISEAMRLYPPAWLSDRVATRDDHFKDYLIPANTIVILFYYGMHRDPKLWTDPEKFNPSRFFPENYKKDQIKNFYPFGAGPRLCIGNNFAMAEMAIFIYHFFRQYKVSPGSRDPKMHPLVTLKPDMVPLIVDKI